MGRTRTGYYSPTGSSYSLGGGRRAGRSVTGGGWLQGGGAGGGGGFSPYASLSSVGGRGGAASQPSGGGGSRDSGFSRQTSRTFEPFQTSRVSPDYGDLISRYKDILAGGANSFQDFIGRQRSQGLEQVRNEQASRGLSARSGVGVSGATNFLEDFNPRAGAMQADYIKSLLGGYGAAVNQGRTSFSPVETGTTQTGTSYGPAQPPLTTSAPSLATFGGTAGGAGGAGTQQPAGATDPSQLWFGPTDPNLDPNRFANTNLWNL